MVKKWPKIGQKWSKMATTIGKKNNQSFQSMMLYNGAKTTFYLSNIVY